MSMTKEELDAIRQRLGDDQRRMGIMGAPQRWQESFADRAALLAEVERLQRESSDRAVRLAHAQGQVQTEQGERFKYGRALEQSDAELATLRAAIEAAKREPAHCGADCGPMRVLAAQQKG